MKYERMTDSFKFLLKINYEQPSPSFFFRPGLLCEWKNKQEKIDVNTELWEWDTQEVGMGLLFMHIHAACLNQLFSTDLFLFHNGLCWKRGAAHSLDNTKIRPFDASFKSPCLSLFTRYYHAQMIEVIELFSCNVKNF